MASSYATASFQVAVNGVNINTTVADTAPLVNSAIEELRALLASKPKKVVGLDCEWRPYDEYRQPPNKVATLQLCSESKCVIIQLFYLDYIPASLRSFLSDPQITFVGVRVEEDAQKLADDYGLAVCKTTDIGDLAISRGYGRLLLTFKRRLGLKDIAAEVARIRMEKPLNVTRSDWQVRKLSQEQIKYACIDAYASYAIGHKLLIENAVPPRFEFDPFF